MKLIYKMLEIVITFPRAQFDIFVFFFFFFPKLKDLQGHYYEKPRKPANSHIWEARDLHKTDHDWPESWQMKYLILL